MKMPDGSTLLVPCLAYIDDVVLLASTREMLQAALDAAAEWADELTMRLNIGEKKKRCHGNVHKGPDWDNIPHRR